MEGFLLIDKAAGMTSHDVVNRVRRSSGVQRVGHAGTLDPFATGLLIVGVGRAATKHLGGLTLDTTKTYEATLRLGARSDTDDCDGVITETEDLHPLRKKDILPAVKKFQGPIRQIPPALSAIKIRGVPAYRRLRRGEEVELPEREVEIYAIRIRTYAWPELKLEVECSSGTYIRTLARDIGEALGCGAYLRALRRTAIGKWNVRDASTLSDLQGADFTQHLRPITFFA
ncbi:MAG: tRNA pseudouridine(55) synthase TruB [Candidatus Nomurabacteria bacterium]|nr:MAG: tRNA pseudouridine(55) synthase TruB [Candidatus Nomurabacteria bacterium]